MADILVYLLRELEPHRAEHIEPLILSIAAENR